MRFLIFSFLISFFPQFASASTLFENFQNSLQLYVKEKSGKAFRVYTNSDSTSDHARPFDRAASWEIEVDAGLRARVDSGEMPKDIFDLILCHELGHLDGGEPRDVTRKKINGKYINVPGMSIEGQADYYAASVCLEKLWAEQDNSFSGTEVLPSEVIKECKSNPICARINRAALWYATHDLLKYERTDEIVVGRVPNFLTPAAPRQLPYNLTSHPSSQCRLDTYYAGSVQRPRPACWYVGAE